MNSIRQSNIIIMTAISSVNGTQGHLVYQCNLDKSQRLSRLDRQPAVCRPAIRMDRPPQQPNYGVCDVPGCTGEAQKKRHPGVCQD
jgi:hypothetical protein